MDDLGRPVSPRVLRDGVPVYDRHGEHVGVVDRVMIDEPTGIFEGLIIHTRPVVGGAHLFAAHDQIGKVRERGVELAVDRAELHELGAHHGRRRRGDERPEPAIEALLRKAWDWLSGVS